MEDSKAPREQVIEQEFKIQKMLEDGTGTAAANIANAASGRWSKHMGERGLASRYVGLNASYEASPAIFRASLYFEAWRDAMAGNLVYLTDDRVKDLRVESDLKEKDSTVNVFQTEAPKFLLVSHIRFFRNAGRAGRADGMLSGEEAIAFLRDMAAMGRVETPILDVFARHLDEAMAAALPG